MSVPAHPNEDEYSALLIVSTTKRYPFQCAEVADMKASADNKPAVVRWRFHEGQSSRLARLPFMEAERKHDSHCESCALNPAIQAVPIAIGPAWIAGSSALLLSIAERYAFSARNSVELYS